MYFRVDPVYSWAGLGIIGALSMGALRAPAHGLYGLYGLSGHAHMGSMGKSFWFIGLLLRLRPPSAALESGHLARTSLAWAASDLATPTAYNSEAKLRFCCR